MTRALVELRSDTMTVPTDSMRQAMATAEVGDDVSREDPTVNELEAHVAELFDKPSALLVSSGTQGNLCAVITHCRPRDEVIAEERAHIVTWEVGGWASLAGVTMATVLAPRGIMTAALIEAVVKPIDVHLAKSRLVCVENTHNGAGGVCVTPQAMSEIRRTARVHDLAIHVDGARIFNAATALDMPVSDLVRDADSVQFCLSKSLGAPIGSMLVGSESFIQEARRVRKMLGGGMRQAGVIAAAGLVALRETPPKLAQDHANARVLAGMVSDVPGLTIDAGQIETNIVFFQVDPAMATAPVFAERVGARGVRIIGFEGTQRCRAVTHHQVSQVDVRYAGKVIGEVAVELMTAN